MTAEIAILNKHAVALAADSAVTIGPESKVYNSANKLFQLSKFHPVGIMIFGGAEFMGVPWETIIKQYRRNLGSKFFDTLKDYSADFFKFLPASKMFSPQFEEEYAASFMGGYFAHVQKEIIKAVEMHIKDHGQITDTDTQNIANRIIQKEYDYWQPIKLLPHVPTKFEANFLRKNSVLIKKLIDEIFQKIPLAKNSKDNLSKILPWLFCKDNFHNNISGLVFAGFGENDIFPEVLCFNVESKIGDFIKYAHNKSKSNAISEKNTAAVIPFAQSEMVATFMEGIDPKLNSLSSNYLSALFSQYPLSIVEALKIKNNKNRENILKNLQKESKRLLTEYSDAVSLYQRREHVTPIVDMVQVLPKDELASMAEALVSLTSFKRRVTAVAETVGGPIDVAVISKGDGFVWITRKHYFKPEFNHHFFNNYFKETCGGDEKIL